MSGDPLKKVSPGDPLKIPARAYNLFIDTARDFQDRQKQIQGTYKQEFNNNNLVLVKNNSGGDRSQFNVLGIDGVVFTPTDNLEGFKNQFALKGITPSDATHQGKFIILAEPLKSGAIGHAWIAGICIVKVNVINVSHEYAEVENNQVGRLKSYGSGSARILWKEGGTGEKWALIKIGERVGDKLFKITSSESNGGYYNAYEQKFDATYWKTTTNPLSNVGIAIEIWNLAEAGNTGSNFLQAGEYVKGWQIIDDEGNHRWICCKWIKGC